MELSVHERDQLEAAGHEARELVKKVLSVAGGDGALREGVGLTTPLVRLFNEWWTGPNRATCKHMSTIQPCYLNVAWPIWIALCGECYARATELWVQAVVGTAEEHRCDGCSRYVGDMSLVHSCDQCTVPLVDDPDDHLRFYALVFGPITMTAALCSPCVELEKTGSTRTDETGGSDGTT